MTAAQRASTIQSSTHSAPLPSLENIVREAAHLLPEQAPLHAFVHHNTLHAFEHLPFEEAVVHAGSILGTEAYQPEKQLVAQLKTGRIEPNDLDAVIRERTDAADQKLFPGALTRAQFQRHRLGLSFDIPRGSALDFVLIERGVLSSLHAEVNPERKRQIVQRLAETSGEHSVHEPWEASLLGPLWNNLKAAAPSLVRREKIGVRRRDLLLQAADVDTDEIVHPTLIRLCAAFLDQGVAYWTMPERSRGFLQAVRTLYSLALPPPVRAFAGLAEELRRQERQQLTAEQTVQWALEQLQVKTENVPAYVRETLLALRGWAGMMRQLELRPDKAPVEASPASLMDFLAVRLVLDTFAAKNTLSGNFGATMGFEELAHRQEPDSSAASSEIDLELVYEGFVLAQCLPVDLGAFRDRECAAAWLTEVRAFDETQRRMLLHLAYERHHLLQVLDGVALHNQQSPHPSTTPRFQAVFCIDDREESMRRHLEEACPEAQTFGYPGFFGVTMAFQAAEAHKPRALCPVVRTPKNFVAETWVKDDRKPVLEKARLHYHVGKMTLLRGFVVSLFGALALFPLVMATMFRGKWGAIASKKKARPETRLCLHVEEVSGEAPASMRNGFTTEEMADIVQMLLTQTGIYLEGLAPLVMLVGHGSSSVNNPHLAAYGCGATAGGCGGPNARAFAMMANDEAVRKLLAERGFPIEPSVRFLGGMHDTCKDSAEFYDAEKLPSELRDTFALAERAFDTSLSTNAKERTRLFGTVSLDSTPRGARREAQTRAVDLSEARPEYNHAKNSLCIVGPRAFTRDLFLDQRAFLVSYDSRADDEDGNVLAGVLSGSLPVSAGINLEYLFSTIDQVWYGSGSKLPHNITGLIGVMDGHGSDLRTGLYRQMVELHEPVRLTTIIVAKPEIVAKVLAREAGIRQLVENRWIHLAVLHPETREVYVRLPGGFEKYRPEHDEMPSVADSLELCQNTRAPIAPARIRANHKVAPRSSV